MKFFFVIITVFSFSSLFAQATDEQKLITTVKEFHQALVKKNTVSINQQTDKGLSYGHSNGWIQNKKDLINDFETNKISYQSFVEDSITVTISENVANVRFIANIEATMNGNAVTNYNLRVYEVWVKKGKRWLLFGRQAIKR
jgi:ankyrin repeat protein